MRKASDLSIAAAIATALLGSTLTLTACTASDESNDQERTSQEYVEPGWMAETRQQTEEQAENIAQCLHDKGWDFVVKPDNSLSWPHSSDDENKAREQARFEAFVSCGNQVLKPDEQSTSTAHYRELYHKALDTKACLEDAGYTVDDPPSEDAWVSAIRNEDPDLWVPFQSVIDQALSGAIELSQSQYYELYERCPQAGPVAGMSG